MILRDLLFGKSEDTIKAEAAAAALAKSKEILDKRAAKQKLIAESVKQSQPNKQESKKEVVTEVKLEQKKQEAVALSQKSQALSQKVEARNKQRDTINEAIGRFAPVVAKGLKADPNAKSSVKIDASTRETLKKLQLKDKEFDLKLRTKHFEREKGKLERLTAAKKAKEEKHQSGNLANINLKTGEVEVTVNKAAEKSKRAAAALEAYRARLKQAATAVPQSQATVEGQAPAPEAQSAPRSTCAI